MGVLLFIGNSSFANTYSVDSLWNAYHTSPNYLEKLSLLQEIANQQHAGFPDSTIELAQQSGQLAKELGHIEGEVTSLNQLALGYWMKEDFEIATAYIQLSKEKSMQLGFSEGIKTSTILLQEIAGRQKTSTVETSEIKTELQELKSFNHFLKYLLVALMLASFGGMFYFKRQFDKKYAKKVKETEHSIREVLYTASENKRLHQDAVVAISHEMNTPMNAIMGFSELLLLPELEEEERADFLESVMSSCKNLSSVVTGVMEYSLLLADNLSNNKHLIDVNQLLLAIKEKYTEQSDSKGLELSLQRFSTDQPVLYKVDNAKLEKVLCALVDNAIKYTESGTIVIGYSLKTPNIEFYVADTGIGISREECYAIFDRFHRSQKSKYDKPGMGLGLSMCQELVNVLDGVIWVDSEIGQGSTFRVRFPFLSNSNA